MPIEGAALPKLSLDTIPEAPFYIPATGPATRPRRALKHDDTFVVLDSHGDIGARPAAPTGCFTATRVFCRISSCCSTACSRCCWAPTCATTTRC